MSNAVFDQPLVLDQVALFQRLADGHALLTGNNRLARITREHYARWRLDQGDSQWPTPQVFSWAQWLDRLWDDAALNSCPGTQQAVPGPQQLNQLWQLTLDRHGGANPLTHIEALAAQLQETRRLVLDWQLDLSSPRWQSSENENHQAFLNWNKAFESQCKAQGWLAPEDRTGILARLAENSALLTGETIDLLGFDELFPAQASLLRALSLHNAICRLELTPRQGLAVQWIAVDMQQELEIMARWARHRIESDPVARVAIIVPGLAARREEVQRALGRILQPAENPADSPRPWNISLGNALSSEPMIMAATRLLGLLEFRFDIQKAATLLRSPWFRGAQEELGQRALLEKCLRGNYSRQLNLFELSYRSMETIRYDSEGHEIPESARDARPWCSPIFAEIVRTLIRFNERNKAALAPSAWAEQFDKLLGSVGWPAPDRSRSSLQRDHDWQVLQAWKGALSDLASLDLVKPQMHRHEAVSRLRQICRDTVFQASSPQCQLQVLGAYEANSLRFDHAWVLGLHHGNWPAGAQPNPFIPVGIQSLHAMPHCNPARETEVATRVTDRLLNCAGEIIFSMPSRLDDELIMPSPLLRQLHRIATGELPYWRDASWAQILCSSPAPASEDLKSPGASSGYDPRGGSRILQNQALCPFRAYAENRLMAEPLEAPAKGISPVQHGSLLHRALESFWKDVVSHSQLLSLDAESLRSRIAHHVGVALDEERGLAYRAALRSVEQARLERHILTFLELEKLRKPFEAIAFEKEFLPEIEGQPVRLVIDRIDRLQNGKLAIIDYKTGKVSPGKWFGDRPEDPQLPLYAISSGQTPDAVVLAVVREDGCQYRGISRREGIFPGLPPKTGKANQPLIDAGAQLPAAMEQWRATLHRLMREFLDGEASIDPKNGRNTCANSYCKLQSLCRINELDPASVLDGEAGL